MVQYKPKIGYSVPNQIHHNSYWKLGTYQIPTSYDGRPLTTPEWIGRDQRGLLRYREYSLDELLGFLDERGIRRPCLVGTAGKAVVMAELESEDENAIFPRFLELPAELRVRIYRFHLNDIAFNVEAKVHQPPLTLTSRLLRFESLTMFYDITCLKVVTLLCPGTTILDTMLLMQGSARLDSLYKHDRLKCIRRVHFQVKTLQPGVTLDWMIDLDTMVVHQARHFKVDYLLEEPARAHLEEVVAYMQMRSRSCVLGWRDLELFTDAVWRGVVMASMGTT